MVSSHISEKIVYDNPLKPVRVIHEFRNEGVTGKWHYHNELELIAVVKGDFSIYTKDKIFRLTEGDVAIVGSFEPHHSFKYEGVMEYIVVQFDIFKYLGQDLITYMKYFTETGRLYSNLNYIFTEKPEVKKQIFDNINEISIEYTQKQKGYEIAIHSLIYKIILALLRNDRSSLMDLNNDSDIIKLQPVLDYIEKSINGKVDMKEAAKLMNLDYFYFGKYFKKLIGKTFIEYVNYKKIINAELILLTKDISVMETASMVGMPNMANFYKNFYKYNKCSPKEFRRKLLL